MRTVAGAALDSHHGLRGGSAARARPDSSVGATGCVGTMRTAPRLPQNDTAARSSGAVGLWGSPMQRVLVIGSGGAGKTTFAARLARRTGLPLVHLDALYWRPGWVKPEKDEWAQTVEGLIARDRWVMDGNYAGTLDRRLDACDTAISLDLPRAVCLWRALRRRVRYHRRTRPDLQPGSPERLTWEFVRWIWRYPAAQQPRVLARLDALRPDQRAVILRTPAQVEAFLRALPSVPE